MNGMRQSISACLLPVMILFILEKMRQSISACLLPVMILFILEKKWLKAAMTLLIATSFHKSAVFLIPLSLSAFCLDKKY